MAKSKSFWDHPVEIIEKALHIRKQIEALETALSEIYSGSVVRVGSKKVDGRKGKRSPATIAKMAAAQQARWAKARGKTTAAKTAGESFPEKKRAISAETRAKMSAAQRARRANQKIAPALNPPNNLVW